jgi:predicted ribosome quality control (RQC) complex YloA/Tae2 family protein
MDINFLINTYLHQPIDSVWKIHDKLIAFYFKHSDFPWLLISLENQSPKMLYSHHVNKLSDILLYKHPLDSQLQHKILKNIHLSENGYCFTFKDSEDTSFDLLFSSMPYHPTLSLNKKDHVLFQSNPLSKNVQYAVIGLIEQVDIYSLVLKESFQILSHLLKTYVKQKHKRLIVLEKDKQKHQHYLRYQDVAQEAMMEPDVAISTLNQTYALNLPMHTFSNRGEFINYLFHHVKRAKQGIKSIHQQVETLNKELADLDSFSLSVETFSIANYQRLRERLEALHLLTTKVKKTVVVKAENPYIFTYKNTIYSFGKNQKQNHHLTFHLAQKKFIFVHIKDFPGSHIIIHRSDEDHDALIFAGQLALYLSKQKSGEITYAKVGSLKATHTQGMVIVKNGKTMKINHDYALPIEQLISEAKRY